MISLPRLSTRSVLLTIAVCALAACGKAPEASAGKAAGAQVLPGTISDAMPNLDRSQSQPLLQAAPVARPGAADPATAASDSAAGPADDSVPADSAKPD